MYNFILKVLLISLPEEFFIICFSLILLGREDLIDRFYFKKNICNILIKSVIPLALIFDTLGYFQINNIIRAIIQIGLVSFSIYQLCNNKQIKLNNVFIKSLISYGTFMIIEGIVVGSTYLIMKNNIDFASLSILNMCIILIPERLIEYGILIYVFKNQYTKINFIKVIQSNSKYCKNLAISSAINVFYLIFFIDLFILNHLIDQFNYRYQLLIIVVMLSFPIINFWMLWYSNHDIYIKEMQKNKYEKEDYNE